MLVELTIGNCLSFKSPQTLSMVASPIKSKDKSLDINNVIKAPQKHRLLSSAVMYGANASGKSNFVAALRFIKKFILHSANSTERYGGIEVEAFRKNIASKRLPSHFEIVFIQDGLKYRYGFEVTKEKVIEEWLYFVPSRQEAMLFERIEDEFKIGSYFKEGRHLQSRTRPNALFLSVVAQFDGKVSQNIIQWFENLGIASGLHDSGMMGYTIHQLSDGEHRDAIKNLITKLDLGIKDIKIKKSNQKLSELLENNDVPDELKEAIRLLSDSDEGEFLSIETEHTIYDAEGNEVGAEIFNLVDDESEGTQKLFALSGPIIDTLVDGDVLVIDELDARLHPWMTRELIKLFNDKSTNKHGAQLIFNTQDTNLLDNSFFRRDQIWFVEKDDFGASHLFSLVEFKGLRNDKDYEKGYLEGRFGAVPYLGYVESVIDG